MKQRVFNVLISLAVLGLGAIVLSDHYKGDDPPQCEVVDVKLVQPEFLLSGNPDNSRTKSYYKFDHWSESVVAYLDFIQDRYKPPNDYYKFLSDIGYAEDPEYINKLKRTVNQYDKRRTTDTVSTTN